MGHNYAKGIHIARYVKQVWKKLCEKTSENYQQKQDYQKKHMSMQSEKKRVSNITELSNITLKAAQEIRDSHFKS